MQLTNWFPATIKPVREGVYLVEWGEPFNTTYYNYFDGKAFRFGYDTVERAAQERTCKSSYLPDQSTIVAWRGVAK